MNTAARIQSKCNDFGQNFLVSEKVVEKLDDSKNWIFTRMGELKLRGKDQNTIIYSVEKK